MDTTRWFLQAVVPWGTGYVTIHWHRKGRKGLPGRSCQTVEDALQVVADYQNADGTADIYFCLSTQRANFGTRTRDNAERLNAVWGDLDVDPNDPKKYATVEDALKALFQFCQLLGIPFPSIVVKSGGGLHVYWLSDRVLTVEEWQPFADGLKAAGQASSLKFDAGVTGDVVRVLRVPGTNNWKKDEPRPVVLWTEWCTGKRYNFTAVFEPVFKQFPKTRTAKPKIEIAEGFKNFGPQGDLAGGIKATPLLPFEPIKAGCGWLRNAEETGGRDHKEPEWHQMIRCTIYLEDGNAIAHRLGNQHPEYSADTTNDKWERADRERKDKDLGWPRCSTISENGGKPHCEKCPQFTRGKSPLNLGLEAVKTELVTQELQGLGGSIPPGLRLPDGYVIDEQGRICHFAPGKLKGKGVQPAQLTNIIMAVVQEPSLKFQNGLLGISFMAKTDRKGTTEVFYTITDSRDMGKLLGSKNVTYNNETGKVASMLNKFGMSWIDKLRQEDDAIRDPGTMGWRYHDSEITAFVYGDVLYMDDGTEKQLLSSTDDEFRKWYAPTGSKDAWLRACKLLTDRKRPELDCIIAIAFAAPLTAFAGALYGVILSVWGDPGSSKSTAQQVASAVWGHPKQTRESLNSTAKSIQGRLGRTRNLPAYWDDIQDERHQESLFQCMFVTAEGTEGGRLNTDASYKVRLDWQTLLATCANASFVEFLIKKQKSTTAGMRRVFEFECNKKHNEPGIINAHDASQIFGALEHNYGRIGAEYAKMLGTEHKAIGALVSETVKGFMEEVGGTSDENFWWGACGVLLVGATLSNRLGAQLDVPAMRKFLVEAYLNNRKIRNQEGTEGGTYENTEIALTSFLNHYVGSGNVVVTNKLFTHKNTEVKVVDRPLVGHPIYVQIAKDMLTIVVSKRAFREFLQDNNIHTRQIFAGMQKFFHAKEGRLTLGAGTVHAQTQELCIEIPVPATGDHVLRDVLTARGPVISGA